MKEDFLHYLWKYKKIPLNTTLTNGENLQILSFGEYNTLSGPDFQSAKLLIGEQQWGGNVEMHLKSSFWYAHGHEHDPAYRNVILHVVWEHDIEVFDANSQPIPTLELQHLIPTELLHRYQTALNSHYQFIPCEKQYAQAPAITLLAWNERLLIERLEEKATAVNALWQAANFDWEKVLFCMLLKSFGGTANAEAFSTLGKDLDFGLIRKERTHPLHLEALFLGQAGLLLTESEHTYPQTLLQHYRYLQQKYHLTPPAVRLNFTGLRPQGFPTIRLSQLAQLYETHEALFSQLLDAPDFKSVQKLFAVGVSEFWETHYTFGKDSKKVKKPISQTLLTLIWLNVLIPLQYAYYQSLGKDVSESLIEILQTLPAESNHIISAFQRLSANPSTAFDTQVLLQQYKRYCQYKQCLHCAVGIAILGRKY
ncbi:hypothetical protein RCZ04_15500 [Capnocytophaga sp. HP1101]